MRILVVTLSLLVFSVASAQETSPTSITFKECYTLAVKQSETISINEELIHQAEAQYGQSKGGAFPEIFFGYDSTWQQKPSSTGSTPNSLFISPQTNTKFGIRKKVFTGYRELAAIHSGSSFVDQRKDEKNHALQMLLSDVADAYYGTLQAESDLAVTKKTFELLQDRWKETKERASVGRNRQADVAALETQLRTMEAQTKETERTVQAQRDLLSFLTGRSITETLSSFEMKNVESTPINVYVEHASSRPDVQAQKMAVDVANAVVRVERSSHFPSLDLGANYYLDRTGYRQDVQWDAMLSLEVPIWSWGATQKGVNVAKAQLRQQQLLEREARRRAQLEVQNAYRDVISAHQQADIYQKASVAANNEHTLTTRDYKRGLVTTFEVLETLNRLVDTERSLNLATLRARLAEVNLKIASGYSPEEILQ